MEPRPDRAAVARVLGSPTDQIGSVNDPRTSVDFGVKWNEMWRYKDPEGEGFDRVVLWNRYDFLGVWRLSPDGRAEPEKLPGA
jgi:hypothetical protein